MTTNADGNALQNDRAHSAWQSLPTTACIPIAVALLYSDESQLNIALRRTPRSFPVRATAWISKIVSSEITKFRDAGRSTAWPSTNVPNAGRIRRLSFRTKLGSVAESVAVRSRYLGCKWPAMQGRSLDSTGWCRSRNGPHLISSSHSIFHASGNRPDLKS